MKEKAKRLYMKAIKSETVPASNQDDVDLLNMLNHLSLNTIHVVVPNGETCLCFNSAEKARAERLSSSGINHPHFESYEEKLLNKKRNDSRPNPPVPISLKFIVAEHTRLHLYIKLPLFR